MGETHDLSEGRSTEALAFHRDALPNQFCNGQSIRNVRFNDAESDSEHRLPSEMESVRDPPGVSPGLAGNLIQFCVDDDTYRRMVAAIARLKAYLLEMDADNSAPMFVRLAV